MKRFGELELLVLIAVFGGGGLVLYRQDALCQGFTIPSLPVVLAADRSVATPARKPKSMVDTLIETHEINPVLNEIIRAELSGVVRYTHYSLVITGPNRLPLVDFMRAQAAESLVHAQQAGEILTGLGGHPDQGIAPIDESHDHSIEAILAESVAHERRGLELYRKLLVLSQDRSIYLEEFARGQIGQEELHVIEMNKLLRDYTIG
ncbi:MAG: bacterioferritin [Hyphomicrobiaceae bacterium]|jgi:bacterioferritin